jgi:hypothetical protein
MSDFLSYIFLYEFGLGDKVWRYTSNSVDVIDENGLLWEASSISDDGIKQTGEAVTDAMTITASVELVPARLFMYAPPSRVIDVSMYRAAFLPKAETTGFSGTDITAPASTAMVTNKRPVYVGEVSQCSFPEPGRAVITCQTLSASMQREGLRLPWQRQCPYAIYDQSSCRLNKAAWSITSKVLTVTGNTVLVDTAGPNPDGYLNGGYLEFEHPIKGAETLAIEVQSGTTLIIFGSAAELWEGMSVTLYPGCNQTPQRCQFFDNYLNYGGYPALPGKSPFDGDPVF